MSAPRNVKRAEPANPGPSWPTEAKNWRNLNSEVRGNSDFYPLTIKGAYVIGIIHNQCESVEHLLRHRNSRETTYIPAYGVFAAGVEILGRCLRGNESGTGSTKDLETGFKWLSATNSGSMKTYGTIPKTAILVTTNSAAYQIEQLEHFRHFAAHGQAVSSSQFPQTDYELLSGLRPILAKAVSDYWEYLIEDDNACEQLAKANILALRRYPILKSWILFERDEKGEYHGVEEIFNRFYWTV
jgi:hypothetical protein